MIWKKLDSTYEVSEYGDVKSVDRAIKRGGKIHKIKGKKLKHKICRNGYHRVGLSKNGKTKHKSVHRLVAKLFIGKPNKKLEINHIDGNKSNNHFTNLEWVTRSENMKHAVANGLVTHVFEYPKSQRKPVVKKELSGKEFWYKSLAEASEKDGISVSYLSQIINGDRPQKSCCHWAFATPVDDE